MKKILTFILAAMLLFTVIPFAANAAANGPTVNVSNAAVCPGQVFQIDVTLSGNTGFSALRVDLAIPQGFNVMNITCGPNFTQNIQFTTTPGAIGIATFATSDVVNADGLLCTFIIQADPFVAAGNYTFGFDACEFFNYDLQTVAVNALPATVAAGHNIGTMTCLDQVCATCGVTVPGTGHIFGDFIYDNNATCTQDGTETRYCLTCNLPGESRVAVGSHNFIGAHVLLGYSHSCVSCGAILTTCADNDSNHVCDICNTVMSVCADENNDNYCDVCGKALAEEPVEHKHNLVHTAAKAATCFEEGNLEYWYCADCDCYFTDAEGKLNIAYLSLITPVAHEIEHVEAKEPTATEEGNLEYWYCTKCGYAWLDELCTRNTNLKAVILPATGTTDPEHKHELVHTEAKAATCFEEGNLEYWYCAGCDCYFTDDEGKFNIARLSLVVPVAHKIEHVAAVDATCFAEGNIEYWYCTECGYAWLDELCTMNTNLKAVILPVSHKIEHVAAKAPTATEEGNIEYWYCTECGYAWLDELCTRNTNLKAVILPATGEDIPNPPTGDASILYIAAVAVIATLGVAVISFKKREEN